MKLKIEKGTLSFELSDLVDAMDQQQKDELAKVLVADERLFGAVLELVADTSASGYGHFFNDDENGAWWFNARTTRELREKLLPLMPQAAQEVIATLKNERDQALAEKERHDRWAWKLYHAWPQEHWRARPEAEPFKYLPREDAPAVNSDGSTQP